jgi:hypothetical protein
LPRPEKVLGPTHLLGLVLARYDCHTLPLAARHQQGIVTKPL